MKHDQPYGHGSDRAAPQGDGANSDVQGLDLILKYPYQDADGSSRPIEVYELSPDFYLLRVGGVRVCNIRGVVRKVVGGDMKMYQPDSMSRQYYPSLFDAIAGALKKWGKES